MFNKTAFYTFVGLFCFVVLIMSQEKIGSMLTRGLRLNNPGNIRRTKTAWQGQSAVQDDAAFTRFDDAKWGIRAMAKLLDNYNRREVNTIKTIISTWAPSTENNTSAYIAAVCADMNSVPDYKITRSDYPALIAAIIKHEQGINPFSQKTIVEAINLQ